MPRHRSHGDGRFEPSQFRAIGPDCVFEPGVLVFHPESITLGANVYVGHYAILKGYYKNAMVIGDETWIGQQCFLHAAGGITIGAGSASGQITLLRVRSERRWPSTLITSAPRLASSIPA